MNWKTPVSFGRYEGYPLITMLVVDKPYLKWCYEQKLDEKYPELAWLKENVKPKEWQMILEGVDA